MVALRLRSTFPLVLYPPLAVLVLATLKRRIYPLRNPLWFTPLLYRLSLKVLPVTEITLEDRNIDALLLALLIYDEQLERGRLCGVGIIASADFLETDI